MLTSLEFPEGSPRAFARPGAYNPSQSSHTFSFPSSWKELEDLSFSPRSWLSSGSLARFMESESTRHAVLGASSSECPVILEAGPWGSRQDTSQDPLGLGAGGRGLTPTRRHSTMPTSGLRQAGGSPFNRGAVGPFSCQAPGEATGTHVSRADTVPCRSRGASQQKQIRVTHDSGDHRGGEGAESGSLKKEICSDQAEGFLEDVPLKGTWAGGSLRAEECRERSRLGDQHVQKGESQEGPGWRGYTSTKPLSF